MASDSTPLSPIDNGLPQPLQTEAIIALTQLTAIVVTGKENTTYLNSLLTNDITQLTDEKAQYSGLCNPKGRLIASFIILKKATTYYLVIDKSLAQSVVADLLRFRFRSQVDITPLPSSYCCYGLNMAHTSALPNTPSAYAALPHQTLSPRYLMICSEQNDVNNPLLAEHYWYWLDIQQYFTTITVETSGQFTPQQIDYDRYGVSFNKGCYPGQEVVARLHYLGQSSRQMVLASASTLITPPELGSPCFNQAGETVGHLVNIAHNTQQTIGLISIKKSCTDTTVTLDNQQRLDLHHSACAQSE